MSEADKLTLRIGAELTGASGARYRVVSEPMGGALAAVYEVNEVDSSAKHILKINSSDGERNTVQRELHKLIAVKHCLPEYLDGVDLPHSLDANGLFGHIETKAAGKDCASDRPNPEEAIRIAICFAEVLSACAKTGIAYNDIKPLRHLIWARKPWSVTVIDWNVAITGASVAELWRDLRRFCQRLIELFTFRDIDKPEDRVHPFDYSVETCMTSTGDRIPLAAWMVLDDLTLGLGAPLGVHPSIDSRKSGVDRVVDAWSQIVARLRVAQSALSGGELNEGVEQRLRDDYGKDSQDVLALVAAGKDERTSESGEGIDLLKTAINRVGTYTLEPIVGTPSLVLPMLRFARFLRPSDPYGLLSWSAYAFASNLGLAGNGSTSTHRFLVNLIKDRDRNRHVDIVGQFRSAAVGMRQEMDGRARSFGLPDDYVSTFLRDLDSELSAYEALLRADSADDIQDKRREIGAAVRASPSNPVVKMKLEEIEQSERELQDLTDLGGSLTEMFATFDGEDLEHWDSAIARLADQVSQYQQRFSAIPTRRRAGTQPPDGFLNRLRTFRAQHTLYLRVKTALETRSIEDLTSVHNELMARSTYRTDGPSGKWAEMLEKRINEIREEEKRYSKVSAQLARPLAVNPFEMTSEIMLLRTVKQALEDSATNITNNHRWLVLKAQYDGRKAKVREEVRRAANAQVQYVKQELPGSTIAEATHFERPLREYLGTLDELRLGDPEDSGGEQLLDACRGGILDAIARITGLAQDRNVRRRKFLHDLEEALVSLTSSANVDPSGLQTLINPKNYADLDLDEGGVGGKVVLARSVMQAETLYREGEKLSDQVSGWEARVKELADMLKGATSGPGDVAEPSRRAIVRLETIRSIIANRFLATQFDSGDSGQRNVIPTMDAQGSSDKARVPSSESSGSSVQDSTRRESASGAESGTITGTDPHVGTPSPTKAVPGQVPGAEVDKFRPIASAPTNTLSAKSEGGPSAGQSYEGKHEEGDHVLVPPEKTRGGDGPGKQVIQPLSLKHGLQDNVNRVVGFFRNYWYWVLLVFAVILVAFAVLVVALVVSSGPRTGPSGGLTPATTAALPTSLIVATATRNPEPSATLLTVPSPVVQPRATIVPTRADPYAIGSLHFVSPTATVYIDPSTSSRVLWRYVFSGNDIDGKPIASTVRISAPAQNGFFKIEGDFVVYTQTIIVSPDGKGSDSITSDRLRSPTQQADERLPEGPISALVARLSIVPLSVRPDQILDRKGTRDNQNLRYPVRLDGWIEQSMLDK